MISTSNSGGGQYLTITSCVGRGNWGSFCKGGKKKSQLLVCSPHGMKLFTHPTINFWMI